MKLPAWFNDIKYAQEIIDEDRDIICSRNMDRQAKNSVAEITETPRGATANSY